MAAPIRSRLTSTMRVGQDHWRAKVTDHDVDLIRCLLRDRRALITALSRAGNSRGLIDRALRARGLSFGGIALKFEVSKSLVRAIQQERVRTLDGCAYPSASRAGSWP